MTVVGTINRTDSLPLLVQVIRGLMEHGLSSFNSLRCLVCRSVKNCRMPFIVESRDKASLQITTGITFF